MKWTEISNYLDGFMAWDHGCHDSGIFDEVARNRVKRLMLRLDVDDEAKRKRLGDIIFFWLDRYSRAQYRLEDHFGSMQWVLGFLERDDFSGL